MHQTLDEFGDGLAIGVATGDELARAATFGLLAGIAEQRSERRIDVDNVLLGVGDDHHAVGLVGDGVEKRDPRTALGLRGDVACEHDAMDRAIDGRGGQRDGYLDAAAVAPHEADLVAEIRDRVGLEAFEGENGGIATEHLGARELPDPLRGGVEVDDALRVIHDDDAIVGTFERSQQQLRSFCHETIGGRHRWTRRKSVEASASMVSKTFFAVPPRPAKARHA
ncbi:hypothetical protein ACVMHW_001555 [Bradyrhizobium diazoefficiens]